MTCWYGRFVGPVWVGVLLAVGLSGCTGGGQTPAAKAASVASQVRVLGSRVAVHYGTDVSRTRRVSASKTLVAAAALLDRHARDFSARERRAIGQIHSVSIVAQPTKCLGETGTHAMRLSIGYLHKSSVAWVASLVGHEGQHAVDAGRYVGTNAWRDEKIASQVQLGIGKKIGFTRAEVKYLEAWIHGGRHAQQQHMQQGYPRHCQP